MELVSEFLGLFYSIKERTIFISVNNLMNIFTDKIIKQGKLEKGIKDYLKDEEFGDHNDKLRLLLTYLLGTKSFLVVFMP